MRETKKAFNYKYTMYKCNNCDEYITPAQGMDNSLCDSCTEEKEEVQQSPIYFTGGEFSNLEKEAISLKRIWLWIKGKFDKTKK